MSYEDAYIRFKEAENIIEEIGRVKQSMGFYRTLSSQVDEISTSYLEFQPIRNSSLAKELIKIGIEYKIKELDSRLLSLNTKFTSVMGKEQQRENKKG